MLLSFITIKTLMCNIKCNIKAISLIWHIQTNIHTPLGGEIDVKGYYIHLSTDITLDCCGFSPACPVITTICSEEGLSSKSKKWHNTEYEFNFVAVTFSSMSCVQCHVCNAFVAILFQESATTIFHNKDFLNQFEFKAMSPSGTYESHLIKAAGHFGNTVVRMQRRAGNIIPTHNLCKMQKGIMTFIGHIMHTKG